MEHKIIAVANQKGGVGKTTTCVNLGIGLARQGHKVLLVDFDPQANLTISLGYQMPDELPVTLTDAVYNLLNRGTSRGKDEPLLDIRTAILHHEEGVDLLPSSLGLFSLELTMTGANARETILKRLLAPLKSQYDVILIDCAPTLGMFTLNSLSAADSILIPVSVNFLSIEGISQLLDTVMFINHRGHCPDNVRRTHQLCARHGIPHQQYLWKFPPDFQCADSLFRPCFGNQCAWMQHLCA